MTNSLDLLYGKPLGALIDRALNELQNSKEFVLISDISTQIFLTRPELEELCKSYQDRRKLKLRILSYLNTLNEANIITMEKKRTKEIKIPYFIIYTKTN